MNATLAQMIRAQRNRTVGAAGENISRVSTRMQRATARESASRNCTVGAALTRALSFAARLAAPTPPATQHGPGRQLGTRQTQRQPKQWQPKPGQSRQGPPKQGQLRQAKVRQAQSSPVPAIGEQQLSARILARLRALSCQTSEVAVIEDHLVEDRLRRRRLRPAANVPVATNASANSAVTAPGTKAGVGTAGGKKASDGVGRGTSGRARAVWSLVDSQRLAAMLQSGPSEVATWLERDAKCIDELLGAKPPKAVKFTVKSR